MKKILIFMKNSKLRNLSLLIFLLFSINQKPPKKKTNYINISPVINETIIIISTINDTILIVFLLIKCSPHNNYNKIIYFCKTLSWNN